MKNKVGASFYETIDGHDCAKIDVETSSVYGK